MAEFSSSVKRGIAAQRLGHCGAQSAGIVGVDLRPADVGPNRVRCVARDIWWATMSLAE